MVVVIVVVVAVADIAAAAAAVFAVAAAVVNEVVYEQVAAVNGQAVAEDSPAEGAVDTDACTCHWRAGSGEKSLAAV